VTAAPRKARRRRPPIGIHRKRGPAPQYPTSRPLAAVLVALDSAKRTGYATYVLGRLWDYGEVNARVPAERSRVFADAIQAAYLRQVPVGVVLEVPWGGYVQVALSLHATALAWRESWLATGFRLEQFVERTAGEWRRAFGWSGLPRAQVRMYEAALAEQVIARDLGARRFSRPDPGPDACAAISIGQTIVRARELQPVLGCGLIDTRA